jgi:hypothetical protein
MNRQAILFLFLVHFLASCQNNLRLDTKGIVVEKRLFSPDGAYVALTFHKGNGAMGQSLPMTALMKVEDTSGVLTAHTLPCLNLSFYSCYYPDKWLDNKILQVFLNERPFVKAGIPFKADDIEINGIRLKVVPYDYSYECTPLIEHFSFSPDRKKIMVAYRYRGVSELNISVINYTEQLPRIGNIFCNTETSFNPIVFGKWNGGGIDLFVPDAEMYKPSDYLNKNITLPVKFADIKEFPGLKTRTVAWMNSNLYQDRYVDEILDTKGVETKANITNAIWRREEEKSLFYYEYEYMVEGKKFHSYFRIFKEFKLGQDFEKGDTLPIIYDPSQPLIHRTKGNYSR